MTIVVEAARRSGSLITAEIAADIGREVGAVPGPVTAWRSAGTNALLRDGATVIRDAADALDVAVGVERHEAAVLHLEPRLRAVLGGRRRSDTPPRWRRPGGRPTLAAHRARAAGHLRGGWRHAQDPSDDHSESSARNWQMVPPACGDH
jgi:predicted Rossmann fold nucleotide-binding protein DprA/Smf involved in DNA uptake